MSNLRNYGRSMRMAAQRATTINNTVSNTINNNNSSSSGTTAKMMMKIPMKGIAGVIMAPRGDDPKTMRVREMKTSMKDKPTVNVDHGIKMMKPSMKGKPSVNIEPSFIMMKTPMKGMSTNVGEKGKQKGMTTEEPRKNMYIPMRGVAGVVREPRGDDPKTMRVREMKIPMRGVAGDVSKVMKTSMRDVSSVYKKIAMKRRR